jgi:hypothetical protein
VDVIWLYQQPFWLIALLLTIVLFLALEAGFRLGLRDSHNLRDTDRIMRADVTLAAMLALLGLMLAFTYAFSLSRADLRKQAIVNEANAIETAFLRADLLPEPARNDLRRLLIEYARTRVLSGERLTDVQQLRQQVERSLAVQQQLWPATLRALEADLPAPIAATFLLAINQVLDAHTTRLAVGMDHMPPIVIMTLVVIAAVSLAGAAHNAGLRRRMIRWRMNAFALVLIMLILIIIDFDLAYRGFIQVSNQSMIVLVSDMESAMSR